VSGSPIREPFNSARHVVTYLKLLREAKGWSKEDAAKALGWKTNSYLHLELRAKTLSIDKAAQLAVAFDVPLSSILEVVAQLVETERHAQRNRNANHYSREENASGDTENGVQHGRPFL
jgi:transcriptional regulator with XRE-family HTH domain